MSLRKDLPPAPVFAAPPARGSMLPSAHGGHVESLLDQVATEYADVTRIMTELGTEVKNFHREATEEQRKLQARLQAAEQAIVARGTDGYFDPAIDGPSIGASVMHALGGDAAFSRLKDWNIGTARAKLSAGIRAALTNEGGGVSSSDGSFIPSNPERGGLAVEVQRPLRLLDVLPRRKVSSDSVEFVKLVSTGDAAEQIYEGDEKAEIDVDGILTRAEIVTIAGHTTASRQVLSDHDALQSAIDRVLRHKALSRLEHQIINGAGGQGAIDGLINQAVTFTPTVPVVSENIADRIGGAVTAMQTDGYAPNLVVMNPTDWYAMQTTKDAEEGYLFGSPTTAAAPVVWGGMLVSTPSVPEGTVLVIDTSFVTVLDREEPSVMLSNSHRDFFTRNLISILAELRAGLEVLDEFAVMKVDISDFASS